MEPAHLPPAPIGVPSAPQPLAPAPVVQVAPVPPAAIAAAPAPIVAAPPAPMLATAPQPVAQSVPQPIPQPVPQQIPKPPGIPQAGPTLPTMPAPAKPMAPLSPTPTLQPVAPIAPTAPSAPKPQPPAPPAPPAQEMVKTEKPESNKGLIIVLILAIVIALAAIGGGYYISTQRAVTPTPTELSINETMPDETSMPTGESPTETPTENLEALSEAPIDTTPGSQPNPGYGRYSSSVFSFSFDFPTKLLNPAEAYTVSSTGEYIGFNTIPLRADVMNLGAGQDLKTALLKADLLCNADGPTGSISCENTIVEDFVSASGAKGYKVARTQTSSTQGAGQTPSSKKTQQTVYYFPLLKPVMSANNVELSGVLVSLMEGTASDQAVVDEAARTFRLL